MPKKRKRKPKPDLVDDLADFAWEDLIKLARGNE
jgi:hypothetical protein